MRGSSRNTGAYTLGAAALALALLAFPARAADQPSADGLIEQGLSLRRQGKPDQALKLFQRAHAVSPSPRTFGQMGLVETSLERWVAADMHLSVALTSPDDAWVVKNRAFLEQALATCQQHIGDLVVSGPAGVEVFVAGRSVGTLPAVPAVHLVEGAVSVGATAPGFKPFDQTVAIRPGERTPLLIALSPIAAAPLPVAAPTPTAPTAAPIFSTSEQAPALSQSRWHTWTGASLAIAGAGLVTWGVVWIAIDSHDACGSADGPSCANAYNTKTPGWVLAGVGTAAIAGGAVVFFTGRSDTGSNVAVGVGPSSVMLRSHF